MRRRRGELVPLEADILTVALRLRRGGEERFHGFHLAKELAATGESRRLTAHGTLYKALARLESAGLLASTWEDPDEAAEQGRPRRRLYVVTGAAERAVATWRAQHGEAAPNGRRPGLEPS